MTTRTDWVGVIKELGPAFAARIAEHDGNDSFVEQNYAELKQRGVFGAGVPAELGGGDAGEVELGAMLRELAHYCSSTALAFSMHTHQVAVNAWRWRHQQAPVEGLLRRVANVNLVIVNSGGSDWLDSSGKLEKVEGGYRMTGRKVFASGSPAGDLFMTTGVYDDPAEGEVVLHFPVSFQAEGVRVLDNWRTLGMRATGSNDVILDSVFIPEASVGVRRPKGKWGIFHVIAMVALPLIYSVYVGIAEAARAIALEAAARKRDDSTVQDLVGAMENELRAAQLALDSALQIAATAQPGPETTNEILIRRTLAGTGAIRTVDRAMDVIGGASFFRSNRIERLFRDVQAARFHPLQEKRQHGLTGRFLLGLDID